MSILKEFKNFAVKGNMIDIAIGVIMGTAFNKVVDVMVKNVIMPPFKLVLGHIDLEDIKWVLAEAVYGEDGALVNPELAIGFGMLIEVTINFLILGLSMFAVVKVMNKLNKRSADEKDKTVPMSKEIELMTNMNKLLEEQNQLLDKKSA